MGPLRATLSALSPQQDAYRSSQSVFFDLYWWSRDFSSALKVAEQSDKPFWLFSRGNSALPRELFMARASAAVGDKDKAKQTYEKIHGDATGWVRDRPGDWDAHMSLALAAAGLGAKEEAIREGRRTVELLPLTRDAFAGTEYQAYLAQICVIVGENDQALATLQQVMSAPAGLSMSSALLRIDPIWDPLRNDARFEALVDGGDKVF
jgi:serine/threonine-protein kinase